MSILTDIQKNLGYPELIRIDPNTQDVPEGDRAAHGNALLAQAAIPAVLTGLFTRLQNLGSEAAYWLEGRDLSGQPLEGIFGKSTGAVVGKIASYAALPTADARAEANQIAAESVRLVREKAGEGPTDQALQKLVAANQGEALAYLPASLGLGNLLNNDTLDDRTNKMEGPISGMMHSIEKSL